MKRRNVCVATLMLWCVTGLGAQNLLGNESLDQPLSTAVPGGDGVVNTGHSWTFFLNNGATGTATIEDGKVVVTPGSIDAPSYGIQLIQSPVVFDQGADYELSFDAKSLSKRSITIKMGGTSGRGWAAYSGERKVNITGDWDHYTVPFTMNQPTDTAGRVEFWFTDDPDPVWLDNIVLKKTAQADVAPAPVSGTKTKADEDAITKWELVWADEFNGPKIDTTHWGFETGNNRGWGNNELEVYTDKPTNASIQKVDGTSSLVITARKEKTTDSDKPFEYTSARMVTKGKFGMQGGKLEIRAKLPKGQGIWPALWLLGADIDTRSWPGCGEVDLVELLGHDPATIYSTIHGPVSAGPGIGKAFTLPAGQNFSDSFHTFTFEWRPEHLEFLVDGKLFSVADKAKIQYENGELEWVYDHPFFLILNIAVGGNWPGNPDATTTFPQSMAVDSVRVYKNTGAELGPGEMAWLP